mmetsp:Transcript_30453/g.66928  ORF Transcript_30453/g.66928 Transcript_30453/m.66928 type:complete len:276 (+) Transcript_30453:144-971(+)
MSNSPTDPPNFDAAADQADSATRLMELWRSISSDRSMLHSSKICKLLWFRAFGDASVFRRVVVVAYRDDIERWRKTMKKSGDQGDDAAEVVFAQYDYRTRFNDTINDFTLNFDFQSGDIVVILPSTNYQSISMLGRGDSGRDSYGPIRPLISGSSNSILLAGLCDPRRNNGRIVVAATREDDILMRVDDGGRACLLNVQLEPQATSYGGCVIVEPGSALRTHHGLTILLRKVNIRPYLCRMHAISVFISVPSGTTTDTRFSGPMSTRRTARRIRS